MPADGRELLQRGEEKRPVKEEEEQSRDLMSKSDHPMMCRYV